MCRVTRTVQCQSPVSRWTLLLPGNLIKQLAESPSQLPTPTSHFRERGNSWNQTRNWSTHLHVDTFDWGGEIRGRRYQYDALEGSSDRRKIRSAKNRSSPTIQRDRYQRGVPLCKWWDPRVTRFANCHIRWKLASKLGNSLSLFQWEFPNKIMISIHSTKFTLKVTRSSYQSETFINEVNA